MDTDVPATPAPPPLSGAGQPPPLIAPPAKPRRTGRGWMIVSLVLLVLLVLSVASSFVHRVDGLTLRPRVLRHGGRPLQESVLEDNGSANKIAVVTVEGVIMSGAIDRSGRDLVSYIKDQLDMAADDRSVRAVILKVDSPGGEVLAADDINHAITDFQERTKKPVVAAMGGLAASGGYYISVPCRWIVANELTITGSIGVIMHGYNYRGLLDKVGVRPMVFKSGKFKDMLSGEKPEDQILPEERAMVQSLVDQTFQKFKQVVQAGRQQADLANRSGKDKGRPLVKNWADYADGRILSGEQAYRYGFVDELGDFDAAVDRTEKLARIGAANLIQYEQVFDLSDLFSWFVKSDTPALKVDLGVELPKLQAGRLYFLLPLAVR
ncbi:MAG: signal peptide peptidase SppA [Verrucomicrobia bacterium]|nr:signal peptide peptidase SppA [Verrucomicrobiota bacterium]